VINFEIPIIVLTIPLIYVGVLALKLTILNQSDLFGGASDAESFVIRQPKVIAWIGVAGALFCVGIFVAMIIFPDDTVTWHMYLLCILFAMLLTIFSLHCFCWKVSVQGNEIEHSNFFRRVRTFEFEDIKKARVKQSGYFEKLTVYFHNGKVLKLDSTCKGYNKFLNRVRKYALLSFVEYYRYKKSKKRFWQRRK
jgi:hypothetical protein